MSYLMPELYKSMAVDVTKNINFSLHVFFFLNRKYVAFGLLRVWLQKLLALKLQHLNNKSAEKAFMKRVRVKKHTSNMSS